MTPKLQHGAVWCKWNYAGNLIAAQCV